MCLPLSDVVVLCTCASLTAYSTLLAEINVTQSDLSELCPLLVPCRFKLTIYSSLHSS